ADRDADRASRHRKDSDTGSGEEFTGFGDELPDERKDPLQGDIFSVLNETPLVVSPANPAGVDPVSAVGQAGLGCPPYGTQKERRARPAGQVLEALQIVARPLGLERSVGFGPYDEIGPVLPGLEGQPQVVSQGCLSLS